MAKPTGHGGRDYPDYGVSAAPISSSYLSDMSELAVRLGAANRFDRQGTQLWSESFEGGFGNWVTQVHGATSHMRLVAHYVDNGHYALDMKNDTVLGNDSTIQAYVPLPYLSAVGFEYHLKHIHAGSKVYASAKLYDGSYSYSMESYLDAVNSKYYIYDASSGYVSIDISPFNAGGTGPFNVFKLVADIDNLTWHKLIVNVNDYDLSAYSIKKLASVISPGLFLFIGPYSPGSTYDRVILDNLIITVDEPL